MTRYDIAIIGTGPAGLEAAITAKVRNKNILLLGGKLLSDKVNKAHTIQNYLFPENRHQFQDQLPSVTFQDQLPESMTNYLQNAFQEPHQNL